MVLWAHVCVFIGVSGHASSEFVAVLSGIKGAEVSVWRYIVGSSGLLLVAFALPKTRDLATPLKEQGLRIVLLALFGMSTSQLFFHWSLDYATVTQVATVVTTMPILVVVANYLINKGPISTPKIISGIGAFSGVALLLTDGYWGKLGGSGETIPGVLLALACAVVGSMYMVLVRPLIRQYGAIRITTLTFAIGAVGLWLVVGAAWGIWVDPTTLFDRTPKEYLSILTLGFWNTTIAMVLWLGGLAASPDMGRANYLFFFKPVIAAGLAFFILQQQISPIQILAVLAITSCVLIEVFYDQIKILLARTTAQ
ncbi:MAG: DMT family transporter [Kiloniellaceae bacterium]